MQLIIHNTARKRKPGIPEGVRKLRENLVARGRQRLWMAYAPGSKTTEPDSQLLRIQDRVNELEARLGHGIPRIRIGASTALGDIVIDSEYHTIVTRIRALRILLRNDDLMEVHNVLSGMEIDCTVRNEIRKQEEDAEKNIVRRTNSYILSGILAMGAIFSVATSGILTISVAATSLYFLCKAVFLSSRIKTGNEILQEFIE